MTTRHVSNSLPSNAVWQHFPGSGQPAHFYHANGFPLGVYNPLLTKFSKQFNLSALALRPTWPNIGEPPKRRDWLIYAHDLIAFVEAHYQVPIIGIGHSMGAACTILAAEMRPDLFKALVLIEAAMLSRRLAKLASFMPKSIMNMMEPARSTLAKIDVWPTQAAFLDHCRKFKAYRRFDDEALQAFVQFGLVETADGQFQYAFPKRWEAHNYTQPPHLMDNLARLNIPCVAVRGKPSLFFTEDMWQEWQQHCPNTIFVENPAHGHLLPIENSRNCYQLVMSGLAQLGICDLNQGKERKR